MTDKSDIAVGSEIRVKRTDSGWTVHVAHAGGGLSGKPAKTYKNLEEVIADLRNSYDVE